MKPAYWDEAARTLGERSGARAADRRLAPHPPHASRRPVHHACARDRGQQISVKAAQSIWDRFCVACAGAADGDALAVRLDPARVARTRLPTLRKCGLSERKALYLRDLARHFARGALDPSEWPALDDETLIERLVDVKGIGRWTAEMFLIFHELRADVYPIDDIGLQKAVALHYNGGERLDIAKLKSVGERWRPWRSVATWYLWRSLDPVPVEY